MHNKSSVGIALIVTLLMACSDVKHTEYDVVVIDGDSIEIAQGGKHLGTYHLAYIDAPEIEQPFGREAKEQLGNVVKHSELKYRLMDDYKVELILAGTSQNLMLVERGYAWAIPNIVEEALQTRFANAQREARQNLQGIWSLGHGLMVAPWQWRMQGVEQVNYGQKERFRLQQQEALRQQLLKKHAESSEKNRQMYLKHNKNQNGVGR
jgi:micrococcal nuclease